MGQWVTGRRLCEPRRRYPRASPVHMETDAIAVTPGRPGHTPDFARQREMRPRQRLLQDVQLHLQLKRRACMLVLASTAPGNIFAPGDNSLRRQLKDSIKRAGGEAAFVRRNRGLHQFARQRSWNKHRLALSGTRASPSPP